MRVWWRDVRVNSVVMRVWRDERGGGTARKQQPRPLAHLCVGYLIWW